MPYQGLQLLSLENRVTHVASHAPVLTRLSALVRAARDSRPLTSLSGDQLAMGLSGLCLVHCLATTIFFASIASVVVACITVIARRSTCS